VSTAGSNAIVAIVSFYAAEVARLEASNAQLQSLVKQTATSPMEPRGSIAPGWKLMIALLKQAQKDQIQAFEGVDESMNSTLIGIRRESERIGDLLSEMERLLERR